MINLLCGSLQVPQFILEDSIDNDRGALCNICCTQPRRIAAISVADRVADERGMPPPGKPGSHIGYHVRLDVATSPDTRLMFCTTGILLRRLAGDPQLLSVSHVIVDEVHERTLQGDFLMALLKDLVLKRRQLEAPLKVRRSSNAKGCIIASCHPSIAILHSRVMSASKRSCCADQPLELMQWCCGFLEFEPESIVLCEAGGPHVSYPGCHAVLHLSGQLSCGGGRRQDLPSAAPVP